MLKRYFREFLYGEVRRISILRTRVNKLVAEVLPPTAALDSCDGGCKRLRVRGERMEGDTAYTLALWRVKEGREEEFVEAWKGLSDYFLDLPNPPGTGTLVRSVEDPGLFYSFGPWRSLEDIRRMRSDPRTPEMIGKVADLCEEAKPGTFRLVVTAP